MRLKTMPSNVGSFYPDPMRPGIQYEQGLAVSSRTLYWSNADQQNRTLNERKKQHVFTKLVRIQRLLLKALACQKNKSHARMGGQMFPVSAVSLLYTRVHTFQMSHFLGKKNRPKTTPINNYETITRIHFCFTE